MAAARQVASRFSSRFLPGGSAWRLFPRLVRLSPSPETPPSVSRTPTVRRILGGFVRSVATRADAEARARGSPGSVPAIVAHELLRAGHRYLDVRTPEEFDAGHAVGAANIPYMLKVGSDMVKNPKFLEEVSTTFGRDEEIIVGCRSGKRSLMAASDLLSAGFSGVTDVAGGYSAWVQNGLPSE